jgi:hypothetical protein
MIYETSKHFRCYMWGEVKKDMMFCILVIMTMRFFGDIKYG